MEWSKIGAWEVKLDSEAYRIFPKDKEGNTILVWIRRSFIRLRRQFNNGYTEISFKCYLYRRNIYWKDSRDIKGSCSRFYVEHELARLLFNNDRLKASRLMAEAESAL